MYTHNVEESFFNFFAKYMFLDGKDELVYICPSEVVSGLVKCAIFCQENEQKCAL